MIYEYERNKRLDEIEELIYGNNNDDIKKIGDR
jgi:hypothetical protein